MIPTPEQIDAAKELLKQAGHTITSQSEEANKRPLSWAAVIGVVFGALSIIALVVGGWWAYSQARADLAAEKAAHLTDNANNATRLETSRLYWDTKREKDLDEIKKQYVIIGGMKGANK